MSRDPGHRVPRREGCRSTAQWYSDFAGVGRCSNRSQSRGMGPGLRAGGAKPRTSGAYPVSSSTLIFSGCDAKQSNDAQDWGPLEFLF